MTAAPITRHRSALLAEALKETKLAYQFAPNSYTYHAIRAVLAAAEAHDATAETKVRRRSPPKDCGALPHNGNGGR